jgi:AcrR family transcriptional regulator
MKVKVTQKKMPSAPKQKRAEQTREKIIEAATDLFSKDGFHAVSSKKIAKKANVAIGTFYNHFKDKKSLLFEIRRRHAKAVHEKIGENLARILNDNLADGRKLVQELVQQTLKMHSFSQDLHRELTALAYTDSDFAEIKRKDEAESTAMIIQVLAPYRASLRIKDLEAAAWVIGQSVEAVIHGIKIFAPPFEEKRLTDALGDMLYRMTFADAEQ